MESRSLKRQAQENFRTYVNVFFFKPLETLLELLVTAK